MAAVVCWKTRVLLPISLPAPLHTLPVWHLHAWICASVCVFVVGLSWGLDCFKAKEWGPFFVSLNLLFVFSICPFNHVAAQSYSHCHCPHYCLFYRLPFYYREIPFSLILTIHFVPSPVKLGALILQIIWGLIAWTHEPVSRQRIRCWLFAVTRQ